MVANEQIDIEELYRKALLLEQAMTYEKQRFLIGEHYAPC